MLSPKKKEEERLPALCLLPVESVKTNDFASNQGPDQWGKQCRTDHAARGWLEETLHCRHEGIVCCIKVDPQELD